MCGLSAGRKQALTVNLSSALYPCSMPGIWPMNHAFLLLKRLDVAATGKELNFHDVPLKMSKRRCCGGA